jgi:STE24 endopeptidase
MTATRVAKVATLVALAVGWVAAAWLLWRTTLPGDLRLPHVDATREFSAGILRRTARYDGFLRWDWIAATVASLVVLGVFVWLGPRIARAFEVGRVGAGVLVGTVTTLGTWAVGLPFGLLALWWGRRYGIHRLGYFEWLLEQWPALLGQVVGLTIVLTILLLLAGRFGRRWWLVAAPLFTVLAIAFLLVLPFAESIGTRPPHKTPLAAEIRELARKEGVGDTPLRIQTVSDQTTAANAFATGLGPSARVFIWDTFLSGRFSPGEIKVVAAHEFGHIAHRHIWKGLGWSLLLTLPLFYVVEVVTRRRGGMERPENVPLALLVLAATSLLLSPFLNQISRRLEAEADWAALKATNDPRSAEGMFRKFTVYDLIQPDPPTWSYVLLDTHPTVVQRIAMARAWQARAARGTSKR